MIAASFSILKVKLLRYGLCLASAAAPEQSLEIFRLFIVEVDEIWPPCRAINSVWNKIWFSVQVYWIMNLFTRKATSKREEGANGGEPLGFPAKNFKK